MRTVVGDGKSNCIQYQARADKDGGLVTVTLVPDGLGGYFEHRSWHGVGIRNGQRPSDAERLAAQDEARQMFAAMDQAEIDRRAKVATAISAKA
jgi:hypothetical protein